MPASVSELVAPHGSLGVVDRVRLAAFQLAVVPSTGGGGGATGGGGTTTATPASGQRVDAPARPDPPAGR